MIETRAIKSDKFVFYDVSINDNDFGLPNVIKKDTMMGI
jgi:hypothetical protein